MRGNDACNRHPIGADNRPKVCAVLQIRTQKALADVKRFRLRFAAVREAAARPSLRAVVGEAHSPLPAVSDAKVLLLSVFLSTFPLPGVRAHVIVNRRGGGAGRLQRVLPRHVEGHRREIFSRGLLTVKKSVIRFRPADLACEQSEPNRHPVAKHNQNIRRASQDGGVGVASSGEMQAHPQFDTCLAPWGRYPRIRHDAHDATAVPAH